MTGSLDMSRIGMHGLAFCFPADACREWKDTRLSLRTTLQYVLPYVRRLLTTQLFSSFPFPSLFIVILIVIPFTILLVPSLSSATVYYSFSLHLLSHIPSLSLLFSILFILSYYSHYRYCCASFPLRNSTSPSSLHSCH